MSNIPKNNFLSTDEFRSLIFQNKYDYIDFGCGKGGSLEFAKVRFGGKKGLGIDVDENKVRAARKAGFHALKYDISLIPDEELVSFTVLSHFLEHVSNLSDVKKFVRKAISVSKNFVFIQQPYFDADGWLFRNNLKTFWSDYTGHPNRMTSYEMWQILRDLIDEGYLFQFSINAYKRIMNSNDPSICPLSSQKDIHECPVKSEKKLIDFSYPVYRELNCLITKNSINHLDLLRKIRYTKTFYSTLGCVSFSDKNAKVSRLKDFFYGIRSRF